MKFYTREEATMVNRPARDPWSWSDPIQAIVQDSYKFGLRHEFLLELCEGFIENLYSQGFILVRESREDELQEELDRLRADALHWYQKWSDLSGEIASEELRKEFRK